MADPNKNTDELLRMAERAIRECYPEFADEILVRVIAPEIRSYQLIGPGYNSCFTILENALAKYDELKPTVSGWSYGGAPIKYYHDSVRLIAVYNDKVIKSKKADESEAVIR